MALIDMPPEDDSGASDEAPTAPLRSCRWGTPAEFTRHYEEYLDTVYRRDDFESSPETGRQMLAASITNQIRMRGAKTVLDCGAGTGFPALDIAADPPSEDFVIHCTDSDQPMLDILAKKVRKTYGPDHGIDLESLAPKLRARPDLPAPKRMLMDWADLEQVQGYYDYVMCRGNSLVYASTWAGGDDVASLAEVKKLLSQIATRVRRGGYLHVDAPRQLKSRTTEYTQKTSRDGNTTIWEEVVSENQHRRWRLRFNSPYGHLKFNRFSTLMTIDDVSIALKELGFTETEPRELEHERPGFGVIIAKKPS